MARHLALPDKPQLEAESARLPHGEHPLEQFVRRTFGDAFASLVLAGLHRDPAQPLPHVRITEPRGGQERRWELQVLGPAGFPADDEPLVLAALLKLLLQHSPLPQRLRFATQDLIPELGWPEGPLSKLRVSRTIEQYAGVAYRRREVYAAGQAAEEIKDDWCSLLTGYEWEPIGFKNGVLPWRVCNSVSFAESFIAGLKEARVVLAGIQLGRLNAPRNKQPSKRP